MPNEIELSVPVILTDALIFLDNVVPDKDAFFDVYLDVNDDDRPCWQKTFYLAGCVDKTEAINFINEIWPLVKA